MIVPSKMMICGTMTLPYLFRIHLFGVGAKVEDSIISGLVTRQGGNCGTSTKISFPVAFPKFCGAVTLGQIYGGGRSDHYGNLGEITATGFTKDSWDSMYIAIGI